MSAFINQNYYPVKFNTEGKEEVNFNGNRFKTLDMTQIEREEMLGISSLPILVLLAIQPWLSLMRMLIIFLLLLAITMCSKWNFT